MKFKAHSCDKAIGEWKIQLTTQANVISSKDLWETRIVPTWSDNMEIMMGSKIDNIINLLTYWFSFARMSKRNAINK